MDTKQLINDAKARFKHNSAKQYLKDKYQSRLTFADQGGLWISSPTLLSHLVSSTTDSLVLLDEYENPIKVDRIILLKKANEIYTTVMEQWYIEWSELEHNR
jgi:hypothetical protein